MPSIRFQIELAAKISISTALVSLPFWSVSIFRAREIGYLKALAVSGLGTELLLTIRALISSQVVFNWTSQSPIVEQFVSPSLLFAEYNFFTYIFEVGAVVSVSVSLPTCGTLWIAKRTPSDALSNYRKTALSETTSRN